MFNQPIMTTTEILNSLGPFSMSDIELFETHMAQKTLAKNEVLLPEGAVCKSFYFIVKGSFFQYCTHQIDEVIIDLHVQNEWMFNQQSLTEQKPSTTTLKAFAPSEVIELTLHSFHHLCSLSPTFLQFGKLLNQTKHRTSLFDNALNPADKYKFITQEKPEWIRIFPLKMIASYLKVTPETLSRIRAAHSIY